ncbi:MDR family MFS transporter [Botrimarina hoheduenensis]|uniref:Multidrug resistance protein MdtH n=1 Tax=Botrimarina hoheduenensis TaxID=2528000 RepID=A0A5C5VSL2_9BACT|nr:MFS transporter [Botrimarina hoheduenensis]TWT41618.1 multidrug resistance protein MdtH [Botrimarina hoheduenensis]
MARWMLRRYAASFEGLPHKVWLVALALLLNRCGTMVFPFLALYLSEVRGFEPLAIGWILAASGLGGALGCYLGGWLTSRIGPVAVMLASFALSVPAYAVIPFCSELEWLLAALVLRQFMADLARPAAATGVTLFVDEEQHAQAIALNRLANNLGFSIGPVIGGLLAEINFFWLFPVNAAASGIAAVVVLTTLGKHLRELPDTSDGNLPASTTRGPWTDRQFLAFLGLFILIEVVAFQTVTTLPLFWREQCHLSKFAIGVLYAVNTLMVVLFEMPLTHSIKRFPPLMLVAIGTIFVAIGFGLTPWCGSFLAAAALVALWTVGEMISAPFSATYVAGRSRRSQRGAYMGAYSVTIAVAGVIAPVIGTALYRSDPNLPWWCAIVSLGTAAVGMAALARRDRGPLSRTPAILLEEVDSPSAVVGL